MEIIKWIDRYFPLSLRLWRYLLYPPRNAVFWRVLKQNHEHKLTAFHLGLMILGGGVISYAISAYFGSFGLEFPIIALVVLVIFSSIITIVWLISIATNITYEYQQATYDLICVTPSGTIGANWSIVTGILHRHSMFRWLDAGHRWFSALMLLVLLSLLLPMIPITYQDSWNPPLELFLLSLEMISFAVFVYIGYIQSVIQGVLIAMLIPQTPHHSIDVVVGSSIFIFITLQIIMLAIFLFGSLLIQSYFIAHQWQYHSILPQIFLLFAMRELCISYLWKLLSQQLNGKIYDLDQI